MGKNPTARIETISPAQAEQMLAHNTHNRTVNRPRVNDLARDMTAGRWQVNGEAIKFASDGTLLDGQHRLMACVRAGQPFTTLVIRGLPAETQSTMDTGRKRSMSDVMSLEGKPNGTTLASVTRIVYLVDTLGPEAMFSQGIRPTNTELLDFYNKLGPQLDALTMAGLEFYSKSSGLFTPTVFAGIWWLLSHKNLKDANRFLDQLASGAGLEEGNPILVLRNELFAIRTSRNQSTFLQRRRVVLVTFKAWNKWRKGKTIKQLRAGADETLPKLN